MFRKGLGSIGNLLESPHSIPRVTLNWNFMAYYFISGCNISLTELYDSTRAQIKNDLKLKTAVSRSSEMGGHILDGAAWAQFKDLLIGANPVS